MEKDYFIHESSYIDEDVVIGAGTKVWHFSHIQSGARIGENCSLGQNINIGNNVIIGNGCKIQNNVSVYEGVELEDYVFCGPSCVFTNDLTPRSKYSKGSGAYLKTVVKRGASIGANSTIVCSNTIGKWAIIGAGAVVTKDVLDHALVAGVPARQVGWVCECGEGLGGERLEAGTCNETRAGIDVGRVVELGGCCFEGDKAEVLDDGGFNGLPDGSLGVGFDDGRDVDLDAGGGGPSKAYVCRSCGREYVEVDSGLKEK